MRLAALQILPLAAFLAAAAWAGPADDDDMDGVPNVLDICSQDALSPSPCSWDDDNDGYGNRCDGDFNNDGVVNAVDSGIYLPDLLAGIATPGLGTDLDCDGVVNAVGTGLFLGQLGAGIPGPSGLPCAGTVPCPPPPASSAQLNLLRLGLERVATNGVPPPDFDMDGTPDVADICSADPLVPSVCALDSDNDGIGNRCDGDFNNDGVVASVDAGIYLPSLASGIPIPSVGTDMSCDGLVNAVDSALFIGQLQSGLPGPSGLPCAHTVPCP
jgi:hypothetical protein